MEEVVLCNSGRTQLAAPPTAAVMHEHQPDFRSAAFGQGLHCRLSPCFTPARRFNEDLARTFRTVAEGHFDAPALAALSLAPVAEGPVR